MALQHVGPHGPGYAGAVIVDGPLAFISGQISMHEGRFVGAGEFDMQVRQVFENVAHMIAQVGATPADVVKLTHFVVDLSFDRTQIVRMHRNALFANMQPPASTLLGVQALAMPDALYELEVIVRVPDRTP